MYSRRTNLRHYLFAYNDESFLDIFTLEQLHLIRQQINYTSITALIYDIISNNGCTFICSIDYNNYINGNDAEELLEILPQHLKTTRELVYVINKVDLHYLAYENVSPNLDMTGFRANIVNENFYETIRHSSYTNNHNLTIDEIDVLYNPIIQCFVKILDQIQKLLIPMGAVNPDTEYTIAIVTYNSGSMFISVFD
jgi:hypothetical protein